MSAAGTSSLAILRDRAGMVLLGAACAALVLHALAYDFVTDDAYISFVYARNLAEHGELTFNLGAPVEGYTNFLWTVLLGGAMKLGVAPELSSRVLGALCALGTLLIAYRIMTRVLPRRSAWAALPPILLASSSGFACWTSGGLETQLFTVLVTAALDAFVAASGDPRALRRAAICLALASMTRPEGPLVAAVLGAAWVLLRALGATADDGGHDGGARRRFAIRHELVAAAWFLALWAPWFAWRWHYYGHPFPNTYYVKAAGPWAHSELARAMVHNGFYYLWVWLQQTHLVYALPLVALGLVGARPRTPRFALGLACLLLAVVYAAYTISVGGDFMGLHRFIMPLFVIAAIAVTLGLEWLVGLARPSPARAWAGAALAVLVASAFAVTQVRLTRASLRWGHFASDRGIDTPAYLIAYTEDRAAIGRAMAPCFRPDDFSIVGGAGAQPYYGRMRGIDVFGLVSERVAHEEPRIKARAGHTKFASNELLAQHDPTFVFSCYLIHRTAAQPQLGCAGFWRARGYELVTMHVPAMRQQGEYYTFLAKKARDFRCPGRVH